MSRSKNSRKGRHLAFPSRQLCSCNNPNCDVKRNKGEHKQRKSRRQR